MTELSPEVKAYLSSIGKKGGSSTSEAKKRAVRENGKKHKAKNKKERTK